MDVNGERLGKKCARRDGERPRQGRVKTLRRSGDVARETPALGAAQRHVRTGRGRHVGRITLDGTRTRGATQGTTGPVGGNEMKRLRRVIRVRTWLSHDPSK